MEKLLLVDDEEWILEGFKLQLPWEKYGICLTDTAQNGADALEVLKEQQPSIVMTDIRMPKMDGLELAKYIYDHALPCEVIIVSGYADFEYAKKAIAYGVSAYITKPVEKEELETVIEEVLNRITIKREHQRKKEIGEQEIRNRELSERFLNKKGSMENFDQRIYYTMVLQLDCVSCNSDGYDCFLTKAGAELAGRPNEILFRNQEKADQYIMIIDFEPESMQEENTLFIQHEISRLLHMAGVDKNAGVVVGISKPYRNTTHSFQAYLQAKFVVENTQAEKTWKIISIGQLEDTYADIQINYDTIELLISSVELGNRRQVKEVYQTLASDWAEGKNRLIRARMNIQEILVSLSALL